MKNESEIKRNMYCVYLTKKEQKELDQKAQEVNLAKSAYIRELVLNTNYIKDRALFEELLNTNKLLLENIHRIGSNINQIAYALNINVSQSDESIAFEMRELKKLLQEYKDFFATSKFPKLLKKRKFSNE